MFLNRLANCVVTFLVLFVVGVVLVVGAIYLARDLVCFCEANQFPAPMNVVLFCIAWAFLCFAMAIGGIVSCALSFFIGVAQAGSGGAGLLGTGIDGGYFVNLDGSQRSIDYYGEFFWWWDPILKCNFVRYKDNFIVPTSH